MILNPVHDAQLLSILDNMHAFNRQFRSIRASYSALYDEYDRLCLPLFLVCRTVPFELITVLSNCLLVARLRRH